MGVSEFTTYLILSYFAHTVAKITAGMAPVKNAKTALRLREWLSSGFGIGLAFATGADLLADLGVTVLWPPLGLVVTGILIGQGAKFGVDFVRGVPVPGKNGRS